MDFMIISFKNYEMIIKMLLNLGAATVFVYTFLNLLNVLEIAP